MFINGFDYTLEPETDLREATLAGANLRWANLRAANLREADLRWANLTEVTLTGAILTGATIILGGYDRRGYLFYGWRTDDGDIAIRAGCRQFTTLAQARAHWEGRHLEDPMLHADCLSLVERIAALAQCLPVPAEDLAI